MLNEKKSCFDTFPKRKEVKEFVKEVRNYLFPGYFEKNSNNYREKKLNIIKKLFLKYICCDKDNLTSFINKLADLEKELYEDLEFFYESDPASEGKDEIIITYPGFYAITFYRIAHILYNLGISYVPRLITEIAHSDTGIDIHPACKIGSPFFIDHGTGIVIGETSEIGKYVKIYHGVTLGGLSLKDGRELVGKKRHPTIKDYVTIYSGASILGGETIIEERATIGSNVFIVNSIVKDTKVIYSEDKIKVIK